MIFLSAILTGLIGIIIYPTVIYGYRFPEMGPLAWVYLVPLLVTLLRSRGKKIFFASFLASFIFYIGSLYWLIPAMHNFGGLDTASASGVLILIVIILSLFFSVAVSFAFWVWRRIGFGFSIILASFLLAQDYARTYFPVGGFPWSMAGYSQGAYLSFFQWIDVTGIFGLTFLIFLMNALLAETINCVFKGPEKLLMRLPFIVLVIMISFGGSILDSRMTESRTKILAPFSVALIQGNIPMEMKHNSRLAQQNLSIYLAMTREASQGGVDLAIWPETAYPFAIDLEEDKDTHLFGHEGSPVPVLLSAVTTLRSVGEPNYYNSALLVNNAGIFNAVYHKMHLVPFGEYVPMKEWLTFARRLTAAVADFSVGVTAEPIVFDSLKLGPLVCYEDVFPDLARWQTRNGADVLVNQTNDAWYGNTSAMFQHLVFSQFRALENRRYLIRSTNNGMTAIIDTRGEIVVSLPPFTKDYLVHLVTPELADSFYTRYGDCVAWLACSLAGISLIGATLKKSRK